MTFMTDCNVASRSSCAFVLVAIPAPFQSTPIDFDNTRILSITVADIDPGSWYF
jgi:hypothetical protein